MHMLGFQMPVVRKKTSQIPFSGDKEWCACQLPVLSKWIDLNWYKTSGVKRNQELWYLVLAKKKPFEVLEETLWSPDTLLRLTLSCRCLRTLLQHVGHIRPDERENILNLLFFPHLLLSLFSFYCSSQPHQVSLIVSKVIGNEMSGVQKKGPRPPLTSQNFLQIEHQVLWPK